MNFSLYSMPYPLSSARSSPAKYVRIVLRICKKCWCPVPHNAVYAPNVCRRQDNMVTDTNTVRIQADTLCKQQYNLGVDMTNLSHANTLYFLATINNRREGLAFVVKTCKTQDRTPNFASIILYLILWCPSLSGVYIHCIICDIRQGCLVYQILKVLEVVKWQSSCWNFWKPKDGPYEERVKFWCKGSLEGGQ